MILRKSTAVALSFGPFVSPTDGVTLQTGLVSAIDHASTGIFLSKNGGALTIRHASVTASTYDAYGNYIVTLDTTDTNTEGRLRVQFAAAASCLPVWMDFHVVAAAVYDALYASSAPGYLQPTTAGRTLDVSAGGEAGLDWANVGSPTTALALTGTTIATTQQVDVNTIKTQAVTCAAGVTVLASVGTAATSTAQTGDSFARIGALGAGLTAVVAASVTGAVGSVTGAVGSVTGAVGSVTGAVGSVTGNVGGNVTGSVASVVGAVGSVTGLTASNLDATVSSRMATYTQPTGFLAATFPTTVASTTNITAGTITTVTNLTNAPTVGDFTATMKTSLNAATPVATVSGTVTLATSQPNYAPAKAGDAMTLTGDLSATMKTSVTTAASAATPAVTVSDKTGFALTASYDFAKGTVAMTEGYAADGATMTPVQAIYMVWALLAERAIAGTTLTANKLDGSTAAMTFTLDSATVPTAQTRST